MIRKVGKFPYDISKFENESRKLFGDEKIIVGAIEGVDEGIIQSFLDLVLEFEKNEKNKQK